MRKEKKIFLWRRILSLTPYKWGGRSKASDVVKLSSEFFNINGQEEIGTRIMLSWRVYWLILFKMKILIFFIYSTHFGKIDPCILIITCLIFDQVTGVDHIQAHIIAKWDKNIWYECACIIHMTKYTLISLLASNGLKLYSFEICGSKILREICIIW